MKLILSLSDMPPSQSAEITKKIIDIYNEVPIQEVSNIGAKKKAGDFDIVGISNIISAIAATIALIWTLKPKKYNIKMKDILENKNIELSQEYHEEINKIYNNNGGEIIIKSKTKIKYKLRIMEDENNLAIYGDLDN